MLNIWVTFNVFQLAIKMFSLLAATITLAWFSARLFTLPLRQLKREFHQLALLEMEGKALSEYTADNMSRFREVL